MKKLILFVLFLSVLGAWSPKNMTVYQLCGNAGGTSNNGEYKMFYHKFRNKPAVAGWIFFPTGYNPADTETKYPLVIAFNGDGERCDAGDRVPDYLRSQGWFPPPFFPPESYYSIHTVYYHGSVYDSNPSTQAIVVLVAEVVGNPTFESPGSINACRNEGQNGDTFGYSDGLYSKGVVSLVESLIDYSIVYYDSDNLTTTRSDIPVANIDITKVFACGFSRGAAMLPVLIAGREIFNGYMMIDFVYASPLVVHGNFYMPMDEYGKTMWKKVSHLNMFFQEANGYGNFDDNQSSVKDVLDYLDNISATGTRAKFLKYDIPHGANYEVAMDPSYVYDPNTGQITHPSNGQYVTVNASKTRANGYKSAWEWLLAQTKKEVPEETDLYYEYQHSGYNLTVTSDNSTTLSATGGVIKKYLTPEIPYTVNFNGFQYVITQDDNLTLKVNGVSVKGPGDRDYTRTYPIGQFKLAITQYDVGSQIFGVNVSLDPAALSFYCRPDGDDNNSGTSDNASPIWTGSVTGTAGTNVLTGTGFPEGIEGQCIRIPLDDNNTNVLHYIAIRISSTEIRTYDNLTYAVTSKTANIGGAYKTLKAVFGYVNIVWEGTATIASSSNDGYLKVTRSSNGASYGDWDTGLTNTALFIPYVSVSPYSSVSARVASYTDNSSLTLVSNPGFNTTTAKAAFILQRVPSIIPYYTSTVNWRKRDITVWIKGDNNSNTVDYDLGTTWLYDLGTTQGSTAYYRRYVGYANTPGDGGFKEDGSFVGPTILFSRETEYTEPLRPCIQMCNANTTLQGLHFIVNNDLHQQNTNTKTNIGMMQVNNFQYGVVIDNCLFEDNVSNSSYTVSPISYDSRANYIKGRKHVISTCKFTRAIDAGLIAGDPVFSADLYNCILERVSCQSTGAITYSRLNDTVQTIGGVYVNCTMTGSCSIQNKSEYIDCIFINNTDNTSTEVYSPGDAIVFGTKVAWDKDNATPVDSHNSPFSRLSGVQFGLGTYTDGVMNSNYMNFTRRLPDGTINYSNPGYRQWRNPVEYLKKRVPNNRSLPKSAFGIQ